MSSVTKIERGGSLTRETQALEQYEPLIVTLHPTRMTLKKKNDEREVEVPYGQVYRLAKLYSQHVYRKGPRKAS